MINIENLLEDISLWNEGDIESLRAAERGEDDGGGLDISTCLARRRLIKKLRKEIKKSLTK